MPATLSPAAKSKVAAAAAVVMAGITAWQVATRDGFTWADIAPVAMAVLGVAGTDLIPNTSRQPVAKAIVHGGFAVASAVTTALAADPAGMTAVKLLTVAAGAALVYYVPELDSEVHVLERDTAGRRSLTDVLGAVAGDVSALMGPDLPPPPAPVVVLPDEPTPIGDAARAASTATAPLPASTPTA